MQQKRAMRILHHRRPEAVQPLRVRFHVRQRGSATDFIDRLRTYGAQQLPLDGEDVQELSREELAQRLELESLQVWPDGRFEAWLHDGSYEWAQSVRINGTAEDGPTEVHWEG